MDTRERWRRWPTYGVPVLFYLGTEAAVSPRYQVVGADRASFLAAILLGLSGGLLWQLLGRRDLADRLVMPAVLIVLGGLVTVLSSTAEYSVAMALFCFGLVGGLVFAEQAMRIRERGSIWRDPTKWSG